MYVHFVAFFGRKRWAWRLAVADEHGSPSTAVQVQPSRTNGQIVLPNNGWLMATKKNSVADQTLITPKE
jgi:hypothetical protein